MADYFYRFSLNFKVLTSEEMNNNSILYLQGVYSVSLIFYSIGGMVFMLGFIYYINRLGFQSEYESSTNDNFYFRLIE